MKAENICVPNTDQPDISVVIPAYRGAASLPALTQELGVVLDGRNLAWEVVLVNDASPDETWHVIDRLSAADSRIRGIDLLHNHGQPTATMCGLAAARGRLVATMDDDLEHLPSELGTLLDALEQHPEWDAVVASWSVRRSAFRDLGTRIHGLADRLAWGTPVGFRHTAFRVMRRPVRDALVEHQTRLPVVGPMLHRVASQVHNVTVQAGERRYGASGFTVGDGMRRVLQNFKSGSTAPLKVLSVVGLVLSLVAFVMAGTLLLRWLLGADSPSGWLSVMLATIFVGGANLLAFGILGSYIDIIVSEVRRAPRWSVRQSTSSSPTPPADGGLADGG